ncbi:hypothetical protein B9G69_012575 [Bdellovibrio sp. SKB1291214]|uniref:hypothetical protein n=1 Tax=Bdellovibrio sp. SKB1291214 TaxID=1732569 RepID=UPI000B51B58B|nr:hypothetical protein [Bdellovibrio sp. SKB1291214]UYL07881.1 hypothetical protein B9G69_012575 [Bdellovibrio sp. SKB1291214]
MMIKTLLPFLIVSSSFVNSAASSNKFRDVIDPDYPEALRKEIRTPSYKLDFNGDGKEDVVKLQINETAKLSRAILILTQKDGSKKEEILKEQPLLNGKVDLTLSLKKAGDLGISERKYFDEEGNASKRAIYKKSPAIEVSYDQDYCTIGYTFDKELKRYEVCD